jgi:hypothetical protein
VRNQKPPKPLLPPLHNNFTISLLLFVTTLLGLTLENTLRSNWILNDTRKNSIE